MVFCSLCHPCLDDDPDILFTFFLPLHFIVNLCLGRHFIDTISL